ncbi:MAG: 1-deoxy-D-xylulose-5-phosphate reductoisomerase [Actinomycetota bacterium]|nr:1-deoxy-D-xylulose-5-phosphate reductoisomerase [Actinomycetota bacterium]
MRPLVVLGATGSIGRQALAVARHLGAQVVGLGARRASEEYAQIGRELPEALVAVAAPDERDRRRFGEEFAGRARFGPEALQELAALPGVVVVNGVVGAAGLPASVAALEAGNRLALANKESLVAGGPVVARARARGGGELIPVDSEHSALFQCLVGEDMGSVRRLILTASGGPFHGWRAEDLDRVTVEEALAHPTWKMGPRVTIDSATLLNKGLEVIEAHYLFGMDYGHIDVLVHPESIVHSLVEFADGGVKAHLGEPDMRLPIQYAITFPERPAGVLGPFSLAGRSLTFEEPDHRAFPALGLAYEAGRRGGSAPAALNAADEVAVQAFLMGSLAFSRISEVLEQALERTPWRPLETVEDVEAVDREARVLARHLVGSG